MVAAAAYKEDAAGVDVTPRRLYNLLGGGHVVVVPDLEQEAPHTRLAHVGDTVELLRWRLLRRRLSLRLGAVVAVVAAASPRGVDSDAGTAKHLRRHGAREVLTLVDRAGETQFDLALVFGHMLPAQLLVHTVEPRDDAGDVLPAHQLVQQNLVAAVVRDGKLAQRGVEGDTQGLVHALLRVGAVRDRGHRPQLVQCVRVLHLHAREALHSGAAVVDVVVVAHEEALWPREPPGSSGGAAGKASEAGRGWMWGWPAPASRPPGRRGRGRGAPQARIRWERGT